MLLVIPAAKEPGSSPIRTYIDNMWIGTRDRGRLPMETPLLGLARLQM